MDTEVKNQIKDQRSWRKKYTVGLAYLLTYHLRLQAMLQLRASISQALTSLPQISSNECNPRSANL